MLGGHDHVGGTEQGVRPGGVNLHRLSRRGLEGHLRAGGTANPVDLLRPHPLGVVHQIQIVDQPLGILGDFQHPLALDLADNLAAAPLAHAADHFFVGQHAFAGGAPVDRHFLFIGQPLLKQLEKDPLGPFVIVGIGGVDFPRPVEGQAQRLQLALEAGHIVFGHDFGMNVVFDGKVLRRQAEGVPAHGIQHVVSLQAALAGHHVQGGVGAGMTHVEPLAGGIGELNQGVELRLGRVFRSGEGVLLLPNRLPFLFNRGGCVPHVDGILSKGAAAP